jgi:hypothetical protein
MAGDAAAEVKLEKHEMDGCRRQPGETDDLVDFDRGGPQRVEDAGALRVVGIG